MSARLTVIADGDRERIQGACNLDQIDSTDLLFANRALASIAEKVASDEDADNREGFACAQRIVALLIMDRLTSVDSPEPVEEVPADD
ncbi:MAG: hypothetical protein WDO56_03940 [Gammaproteobacteria bacterium]